MNKQLMIYVHIPFCVKKCNYCDFLSFPCGNINHCDSMINMEFNMNSCNNSTENSTGLVNFANGSSNTTSAAIDKYISVLNSNITGLLPGENNEITPEEYEVTSIFFGGGTPSFIAPEYIASILDNIRSVYKVSPDAEITLEANPGTLDYDRLLFYRKSGISRLSIGVQSFDDDELMVLGRIHDSETAVKNYHDARRAGFDNINLDLISSLPGQTPAKWEYTLKSAVELDPEHISAYSLIIEPGTVFGNYYDNPSNSGCAADKHYDKFPPLPSEDDEREIYSMTGRLLRQAGYEQYEISNYAKPGFCCKHNIGYWTGREYLGLGLGSSSYMKSKSYERDYLRFAVTSDMDDFFRNPVRRELTEIVSTREAMEEYMFLGLRMNKGVSISEFAARFGHTLGEMYAPVLRKYIRSGFLIHEGDYIRLSEDGFSVSNTIMSEFLL